MTAHMPECPGRGTENADLPWHVDCICPALRACTVRVLGEARGVVVAKRNYWRRAALRQTASDLRRGFKAYADAHDADVAAIDRLAQEATTTCPVPLPPDATEPRNQPGWHLDTTRDSDRSETRTQEAE